MKGITSRTAEHSAASTSARESAHQTKQQVKASASHAHELADAAERLVAMLSSSDESRLAA
jgi:hypothetical protein